MRRVALIVSAAAALFVAAAHAEEPAPFLGCYERVYDAAHLAAHKGQFAIRASLSVTDIVQEQKADKRNTFVANALFKVWIRGEKKSFDAPGACTAAGKTLICVGALSAAEADECKSKRDGLRDCRIDPNDAGSFKIETRPDGVLVSVMERLELLQEPYDGGPYLYFSPGNVENHAFLLKRIACK
jgi:hypothetical protein